MLNVTGEEEILQLQIQDGIEIGSEDFITEEIANQANIAINLADVIIFLTDIKQGVTEVDKDIALILKRANKPVVLVCNKADNYGKTSDDIYEFYNLGLGEPYPLSATNAIGIGDILDVVYENFPEKDEDEEDDETIKVAIIGKPNVGKSSLVNKILGEERVMVNIYLQIQQELEEKAKLMNQLKNLVL